MVVECEGLGVGCTDHKCQHQITHVQNKDDRNETAQHNRHRQSLLAAWGERGGKQIHFGYQAQGTEVESKADICQCNPQVRQDSKQARIPPALPT